MGKGIGENLTIDNWRGKGKERKENKCIGAEER